MTEERVAFDIFSAVGFRGLETLLDLLPDETKLGLWPMTMEVRWRIVEVPYIFQIFADQQKKKQ